MEVFEKLKILYALPSLSRKFTGVYEVSKNLGLELHKLGIGVEVHSLIDEFTKDDSFSWIPIEPKLYSAMGLEKIGYNSTFLNGLIKSDSNVGHIHSLWSYTTIALYKWAINKNKPYLFTSNAYLFESALNNSKLKKIIARILIFDRIIHKAECIQVNTINEYQRVRKLGFKNPICVIPNGVNLPDLKVKSMPPWHHNKETNNKKILLYLSRIHPQKGLDKLVDAWKELKGNQQIQDWHLVIVGFDFKNSSFESGIINFVKSNNLSSCITLLSGQFGKSMDACYANCDAFILPSYNEGSSIAALNAMAFSKPSLITPGCNIPNSFSTKSAIEIQANKDSIILGIIKLLSMSNEEKSLMGENARKLVEENFSWKFISLQIIDIYKWIQSRKLTEPPTTVILD